MRQGPNGRRPRGRHHNGSNGGGNGGGHGGNPGNGGGNAPHLAAGNNRPRSAQSLRHQNFDSNGPDVRVRGNAWQVYEKYQSMARDAQTSGDRVAAENYQQHAEHYYRIIEAINEATNAEQRARGVTPSPQPAFGQQPEVPANYYGVDGNTAAQPDSNSQPVDPNAPMAQAEVQLRNPPPAPSPFFTPDEIDNNDGPQSLVAGR